MTAIIAILAISLAVVILIAYRKQQTSTIARGSPSSLEMNELFALLEAFLQVVGETAWAKCDGERRLESEMDKYRCAHFSFGAIKRLAETAASRKLGDAFAGTASVTEASFWFGEDQAMQVIRRYGVLVNQPDFEVQIPARAGYLAMDRFLIGSPADIRDGYASLKDELRTVIRGYSTIQPDRNLVF